MKLLIVDDDSILRETLKQAFDGTEHVVETAESAERAISMMRKGAPDLLLVDLHLDGMTGIELLAKTKEYFGAVTTVLMSGQGTIDSAVAAMKNGAYDFLIKPFSLDQLEVLVDRIEKLRSLKDENERLKQQMDTLVPPMTISTSNPKMQKILDTAKKVAAVDSTVLITGESGTGKTMLARIIHDESVRAKGPFAVVNCATLSENLLESELFGHVRGSFTGAIRDKTGRLQAADTGTVFLDEIGEVSPSLQTKLLRFLQDREFEKVGDTKTVKVDVRIIAATNKDLEQEVRDGRFREDLYFRLNVIELHMPSLRDRPEDIPALADGLLRQAFAAMARDARPLSEEAHRAVVSYGWPGNIRELKNALERASILCTSDQVTVEDLPDRVIERTIGRANAENAAALGESVAGSIAAGASVTLEELERQHIQRVMATSRTFEEAAATLGINLSTLWRKRRQYALDEAQASVPTEAAV